MVIGRKEYSVALLAFVALIFYLVLLSSAQSDAQTGGDTTNGDELDCTADEEIDANGVDYEIVVCQEEGGDDDGDDNGDDDGDDEVEIIKKPSQGGGEITKPSEIIDIPDKPLPPTGGLPVYGTVAGFVLAGAGLLGLGYGVGRGGPRR